MFIGNSGQDAGLNRGYLDAFDAETGRRVRPFYTVPGDREKPQESSS